ncbi:MAG: sulfite exporter TauE/SafE family protein [bacterium]|nr:sulfite exporter TauE/SafE family protein [bacterium]
MTLTTALIIGLLASISSCLAVVGGLVLSLSAKVTQEGVGSTRTFVLFHAGRLGTFAVLGGVLGAIGGAIGSFGLTLSAFLGIFASIVMILLGLSLVGALPKSGIMLPERIFARLKDAAHRSGAPLALGAATFFLPCGFTQSAQAAALGSGSFMTGLLIMLVFALGTLPMLLALSFGSASFIRSKHAPTLFKAAGVIVIALGIYALLGGLAGLGIIRPLFTADTPASSVDSVQQGQNVEIRDGVQYITIRAGRGYHPSVTTAQAGMPTMLVVDAARAYDCSAALAIPSLGYRKMLTQTQEEVIDLGVPEAGTTLEGTCSMGMYGFKVGFE